MSSALEGLKPESVWKYFGEISRIPRGSKNEAAVARHVLETASRLGLEAQQDAAGNVVVRKPPSHGREAIRSVCLQGHLDMVCEKNADKVHDFSTDPIELVRKDNILTANGTTLGADNGIAVATMMAIMEDRNLQHGPLELLFTVDEETGLTGAASLQPEFLRSRTLLNLDSEEEGALYVGCAGGKDTTGTWKADWQTPMGKVLAAEVRVKGLKGGHSGLDIDKNRGNAIKLLVRTLLRLSELGARVTSLRGGNKRNAIPREAEALVYLTKDKVKKAEGLVRSLQETFRAELAPVEPLLTVTLAVQGEKEGKVFSRPLQKQILKTLSALPHGVIKMSSEIRGLVETSTNVAVITTSEETVTIATSQRSSVATEIREIAETVADVLELGGAAVEAGSGYPGWKPNLESEILHVAKTTFHAMFGKDPEVKAVHAGLECGIIGEKFPGMDMVSMGPTLEAVHSPEERIHIDTVERFWKYLLEILQRIV